MMKRGFKSVSDAFSYVTDCNLATVAHMAGLKSRSNGEYQRQINIAQTCVDWCVKSKANIANTRAFNVVMANGGSVRQWADNYDVKKRHTI